MSKNVQKLMKQKVCKYRKQISAIDVARQDMIEGMVEYGYLERKAGEYYEDNGGHLRHESDIGFEEVKYFFDDLDAAEKYDFAEAYMILQRGQV